MNAAVENMMNKRDKEIKKLTNAKDKNGVLYKEIDEHQ